VLGVPSLGRLHSALKSVDLVHAPSVAVPPSSGVPLVVTAHDAATAVFPETYTRRGRWFHDRGAAAAARRATLVIAVSQAAAAEITQHTAIPMDRIRVVAQGVTHVAVADDFVAETRSTLGVGDGPYVLWVGTLEPRKNLPLLLKAFASVVGAADLPHRLVIVGSQGWMDTAAAVRDPARALGERVCFTGSMPDDQLRALYRGAALFAFPSVHEGFGLPVLEAMAQGTAVVASDIPVLREVGGDAARYVPANDAGAWGDALVEMLRDDAGSDALGRAGRAHSEAFTWERCIERTRAVYREALAR
jgi:glycosyltransferase involved in cell wall biosynthesis